MRFSSSRRNRRKERNRQKGEKPIIRYGISYLKIYDDNNKVSVDEGRDSACIDMDALAEQEEEDGPPYIIAVQGPPKVGKTLLIKSLVEFYTKGKGGDDSKIASNMGTGPVRIIAGDTRRRRIQFVECPNNVNAMIDASKYADAVIFLIDAGYNFEMETFEFLELLKVHGMPKVIGVLTYLDSFKNDDMRANAQQYLMDQFQTNICKGATLFCLSGLDNATNRYLEHEIEQLATYISTMEFHPLSWRAALGPFMLVDHLFDVTPLRTAVNMDTECNRDLILKGYLRGFHIKDGTMMHIAGVGDFRLARITTLADPFPVDSQSTSCMENRAGAYVSFEFHDVPFEMVKNHDPCQPLLIGGITTEEDVEEEEVGYIQVKLERHNWHLKLLKSKDPIIVSVGWRRYETRPIYALQDSLGRYRFLRRTPPNRPCFAMFCGPLPPPNTQLAVLQSLADKKAAFRFLAKGFVVDVNQAAQIVKKNKRIGTLCKISRKTALVKDLLKSDLEIADFKDAKIQTASGIDGKIIEPAAGEDVIGKGIAKGIAKCTFNHKIRKNDTILMNVYEQVVIPRFFNPRTSPDPPDRIWLCPVYNFIASHISLTDEIINNKIETSKLFAKATQTMASYWSMTSQSEMLLCKQQQHVIIAKLEELEREQEELTRIREQLIERAPSQWVQLLERAPPRRGPLEQLRSVHFAPSAEKDLGMFTRSSGGNRTGRGYKLSILNLVK